MPVIVVRGDEFLAKVSPIEGGKYEIGWTKRKDDAMMLNDMKMTNFVVALVQNAEGKEGNVRLEKVVGEVTSEDLIVCLKAAVSEVAAGREVIFREKKLDKAYLEAMLDKVVKADELEVTMRYLVKYPALIKMLVARQPYEKAAFLFDGLTQKEYECLDAIVGGYMKWISLL
jgi:hypothetical protein